MRALLAVLVVAVAGPALAQTEADRVVFQRKTVIRLDGRVIEGAVEGPTGVVIFIRPPTRFGPTIPVRQSFRVELLSSGADL